MRRRWDLLYCISSYSYFPKQNEHWGRELAARVKIFCLQESPLNIKSSKTFILILIEQVNVRKHMSGSFIVVCVSVGKIPTFIAGSDGKSLL